MKGHYDDDFLTYCYDVATLEADGDNTPAAEYSKDNMHAQVIISTAEFLESHMSDDINEDDWNSLFRFKK
jgi:hypothetical protein